MMYSLQVDVAKQSDQRGYTLLEVLIAIVVLGVGLLGLAGLQLHGLRTVQSTSSHAHAAILTNDLIERIHLNEVNAADYVGLDADDCPSTATLAMTDYCAVLGAMTGNEDHTGALENTVLLRKHPDTELISIADCIGCTAGIGMYTVSVTWAERNRAGTDDSVSHTINFKP